MVADVGFVHLGVRGLQRHAAASRHRVAGVDDQVHENLLDLPRVGPGAAEIGSEVRLQLDVLTDQPAEHLVHSGHHRVEVEDLRLQHLLA